MKYKLISTPFNEKTARSLKAGDAVRMSGVLYTGRDAAHKRFCDCIIRGETLPVSLQGQTIYYTGPAPAKPGAVIGSAGPTTSGRMDAYTPMLIEKAGLTGMIGKGNRGPEVVEAMKKHGCVYFAAVGGAGALLAHCIKKAEVVCWPGLGPEAVHKLEVENMPAIVAIDCDGNSLYR